MSFPISQRHRGIHASVIVVWAIYSLALFKFILIDPWAIIAAGIGDLELPGIKVGLMAALPYVFTSILIVEWDMARVWKFLSLMLTTGSLVAIGILTRLYLDMLHDQKPIVHPNETALFFTLSSAGFMAVILALCLIERRLQRLRGDGTDIIE